MGTWGPAIFSDDTASDVREDFKTYIGDGLSPEDATAALLKDYRQSLADPDDAPVFWLALAATQWNMGRLLPEVCAHALRVIDSGEDLQRWEDDPRMQASRRNALEALRERLVSPAPTPKKIRPIFRNTNDWKVGEIVSYQLQSGQLCLFRVIGHHSDKGGAAPIVEILDWQGTQLPNEREMKQLPVRKALGHNPTQLMIGAVSARDLPGVRVQQLGVRLRRSQKPGGYLGVLWRFLDRDLDRLFGLR